MPDDLPHTAALAPRRLPLLLPQFLWLLILMGLPAHTGAADAPVPRVLRWGADEEGGGPYVYPKDDAPALVVGFEVDLAAALGRKLGMKPRFVQCTWDQILPELHRGDIDLALNGYEYTPERADKYKTSFPYYIYELGLCSRRDDPEAASWQALKQPAADGHKKRIGVLGASASDRYVTEEFGDLCEVVRYEGSAEALRLTEMEQLDATVQDLPILQFYIKHLERYPKLAIVDKPAAQGFYVMYARPNDGELILAIDDAIRDLYRSGELRRIYEHYGIWNETQTQLPEIWETWDSQVRPKPPGTLVVLLRELPLLLKSALLTMALAGLSMPLAVTIGLIVALTRAWDSPVLGGHADVRSWARWLSIPFSLYVEVVRGTPLAFQLFVVYFVLPEVGITISAFWAGVMALAVNYSAYEAEIFRLGIQAIPKGQLEAALALGMSRGLAVRRIILPQAVRMVIPATANDFIALFKDTAVCSVIAVEELSKQYSMGAKSTGLFLEMAAMASALYLLMSYPLSLLAGWLERRLKRDMR